MCNYGQGPKWIKGNTINNVRPYKFSVKVTVSDQLTRWKRDPNQLQKCYNSSSVTENFADLTSGDVSSQQVEEEEEKENCSELITYGNLATPQMTISMPRPSRNPPRHRRPPERQTY